jgi:S-DNA-T family DNA segregation ATPase FtsK/SpoIIIE
MTDDLPEPYEPGPPAGDEPLGPRPHDAESYVQEPAMIGGPVDPELEPSTLYGTVTKRKDSRRVPIVPAWLRNNDQRTAFARHAADLALYLTLLHTTRSPKYLLKMAVFAPWGLLVLLGRQLKWATHPDLSQMMHAAASKNDLDRGPMIAAKVADARKARFLALGGEVLAVTIGVLALVVFAPAWAPWLAAALSVPVLAWVGRPADKPIIDRTVDGPRFTRLTGEMVRRAVVDLGVGVREPSQISFPHPGVHKDGPGWLARFNLPGAIVATKVLEKREGLAASLRLPIDQVWPEVGPDHPGQVDLWVGYMPSSRMGQPKWELAKPNAVTSVFDPHPFGTDARQRPISTVLFERNFLLGGQPGSGKSFGARTFATIAALDPTCEMKIAEFKGTGDFLDMQHLCSTYAVGVDDEAFQVGIDIIDWALAECERRGRRIRAAKERGEAPLGKVTPELARKKGSGLHPVFILLDEVHELFAFDKETADKAERAIKRGRALGIIIVLATQIPDSKSLPANITRCVTVRWCMSVGGQVENDMILGTGAYKRGLSGTAYRPGADAGWGVIVGLTTPGSVRSFFPSHDVAAQIVARATQLRGGVVGDQAEKVKARDMLADAMSVLRPGESGLPWAVLAERLAELAPETYAGITGDMVREALARYDVPTQNVKVKVNGEWTNLKGVRRTALVEAVERRAIEG